jgi:hypothetical protein
MAVIMMSWRKVLVTEISNARIYQIIGNRGNVLPKREEMMRG